MHDTYYFIHKGCSADEFEFNSKLLPNTATSRQPEFGRFTFAEFIIQHHQCNLAFILTISGVYCFNYIILPSGFG